MPSQNHIKEAMETLLKIFEDGNLETVARAVFKGNSIPSDQWSFLNRLLMYCNTRKTRADSINGKRQGGILKKALMLFISLRLHSKKS